MSSIKSICDAGQWLDKPLSSVPAARVKWLRKKLLLRGSRLKGEDVHDGPPVRWLGQYCETLMGSVQGVIFKAAVTADYALSNSMSLAAEAADEISEKLGASFTSTPQGLMLWEADDGNAVLQAIDIPGARKLSLFLTSKILLGLQGSRR
ncbi:MAG TPA: hypothetical protein VN782_11315 [Usitatibacter sp.]|nr:hypothetical protein [Usitatibacter sp.]